MMADTSFTERTTTSIVVPARETCSSPKPTRCTASPIHSLISFAALALRETAYFRCHHGNAVPVFSRTRRFNSRVQPSRHRSRKRRNSSSDSRACTGVVQLHADPDREVIQRALSVEESSCKTESCRSYQETAKPHHCHATY